MPVSSLTLREFTVFEEARFELCPGINVLIGANATGKTHAMKALYAALQAAADQDDERVGGSLRRLDGVFRPNRGDLSRLRRRPAHGPRSELHVAVGEGCTIDIFLDGLSVQTTADDGWAQRSLYLPSREVLSMFEGFIAAYQNRELSFDETFYDLCVALSATPLRGPKAAEAAPLLAELEGILGGKVLLEGNRFYVARGDVDRVEAHLVAEGLRKIATLAHLVANGSIAPGGLLLWDEPETNLNPRLIVQVADVLVAMARHGVQVVLATHDYLLTHRLSLLAEYGRVPAETIRFFGLARRAPDGPVEVSMGEVLAELAENPIVDEFARHYDFERELFDRRQGG